MIFENTVSLLCFKCRAPPAQGQGERRARHRSGPHNRGKAPALGPRKRRGANEKRAGIAARLPTDASYYNDLGVYVHRPPALGPALEFPRSIAALHRRRRAGSSLLACSPEYSWQFAVRCEDGFHRAVSTRRYPAGCNTQRAFDARNPDVERICRENHDRQTGGISSSNCCIALLHSPGHFPVSGLDFPYREGVARALFSANRQAVNNINSSAFCHLTLAALGLSCA